MRVTIGMISNQYKTRLNDSLSSLNYYSTRSATNRRYDKTSQDPFSAAQAYKIQREMQQTDDYTSNVEDAIDKLSTAQSAMMTVNTVAQQVSSTDVLQAINGTMQSSDRETIAKKLRQMQQTIVAAANTKYADQYLFGGSCTSTPPFSVDTATGKLLYRGVDVDTGINTNGASAKIGDSTVNFGKDNASNLNGYTLKVKIDSAASSNSAVVNSGSNTIEVTLQSGATNSALQTALQGAKTPSGAAPSISGVDFSKITVGGDPAAQVVASASPAFTTSAISNKVNLSDLANEPMYVDLGLGLSFNADNKTVNSQSAFDLSLTGISFLGYGTTTTASGASVSNNMFNLMGTIANKLDPKTNPNYSINDIQPYIDQFNKSEENLLGKITESGTKSNFLDYAKTRLQDQGDNLLKKDDSIEYVPSADAIMDMKMQDYAYRATLQIGTNILQPTILDFMK